MKLLSLLFSRKRLEDFVDVNSATSPDAKIRREAENLASKKLQTYVQKRSDAWSYVFAISIVLFLIGIFLW